MRTSSSNRMSGSHFERDTQLVNGFDAFCRMWNRDCMGSVDGGGRGRNWPYQAVHCHSDYTGTSAENERNDTPEGLKSKLIYKSSLFFPPPWTLCHPSLRLLPSHVFPTPWHGSYTPHPVEEIEPLFLFSSTHHLLHLCVTYFISLLIEQDTKSGTLSGSV